MSRPGMSTESVVFHRSEKKYSSASSQGAPMHIALIGDFSGRASRDVNQQDLAKRKAIEIDRDNFEEVFEALGVSLKLPVSDEPIRFSEFDDLHPDTLYDKVDLFGKFRVLKNKLKKPELFDAAVEEIQQWSTFKGEMEKASADENTDDGQDNTPAEGIALPADMLGAVLAQSEAQKAYENSPEGTIERLIKDVISPYVEAKSDPRLPEMLSAVDEATADLLRRIMHSSQFQTLEASWRSVYMLVRRLETNSKLKLFLIDVSREEIHQDVAQCAGDLQSSDIYKLLVEKNNVAGGTPYALLNADFILQDSLEDAAFAGAFAALAECIGASAVLGGHTKIGGCLSLGECDTDFIDPDDWSYSPSGEFLEGWQQLCSHETAKHVSIVSPGVMLRLPYGEKTSPIDSFDFEELPNDNTHAFYCWGNGAYIVTLLIAQARSANGAAFKPGQVIEVEDLPFHAFTVAGESFIKPCAEALLTDRAAAEFAERGLCVLRSVKNKASVIVPNITSLNGEALEGVWS